MQDDVSKDSGYQYLSNAAPTPAWSTVVVALCCAQAHAGQARPGTRAEYDTVRTDLCLRCRTLRPLTSGLKHRVQASSIDTYGVCKCEYVCMHDVVCICCTLIDALNPTNNTYAIVSTNVAQCHDDHDDVGRNPGILPRPLRLRRGMVQAFPIRCLSRLGGQQGSSGQPSSAITATPNASASHSWNIFSNQQPVILTLYLTLYHTPRSAEAYYISTTILYSILYITNASIVTSLASTRQLISLSTAHSIASAYTSRHQIATNDARSQYNYASTPHATVNPRKPRKTPRK